MEIKPLSKYPTASVRELYSIAFPLILSLFSSYLLVLSDRFFLSRYSLSAFEACATAGNLYFLFQMVSLRFVSTAQAFVGQAHGAKRYEEASSYTWQMLWFSIASPLVVLPIGLLVGKTFFQGSPIKTEAMTFFTYMLIGNVLFAIEGTLSGFFSGIGDSKRILRVHLISHSLNFVLNILLIFGVPSAIPPLGLVGSALATLIAKGISCTILFKYFYSDRSLAVYKTQCYAFIPKRFFACIQRAIPRAIGQGMGIISWNCAAHILIQTGGIDLLCCSFGSSIYLVLLNDGLGLAILTISSYLIGSKQFHLFPKFFRSISFCLAMNALVLAIPVFFFTHSIIRFVYPNPMSPSEYQVLANTCYLIWFGLLFNGIFVVSFMLITALKDLWFYMIVHSLTSPLIYPVVFFLHKTPDWNPALFWLVSILQPLIPATIYLARFEYKLRLLREVQPRLDLFE